MSERILVVLNETVPGETVDCYQALERLRGEGVVAEWTVYPYLARVGAGVSGEAMQDEIAAEVRNCDATIVLFVHFHEIGATTLLLSRLRALRPGLSVGFWEADWYDPYRKPFPRTSLGTCAECNTTFVCGDGYLGRLLTRHGCRDVRYVPLTGDDRFRAQPRRAAYDFDVVMIGDLVSSRLPFKTMPGARMRQRLVSGFSSRFGSTFAVFGRGWTGLAAHGAVPYADQVDIYARGAVALGCNNLYARYYFSDRLPIAMMSGRPMVHQFVAGCEEIFGPDSGVKWFRTVDEALALVEQALGDPEGSAAAAARACAVAAGRFTTYHALRYIVQVLCETPAQWRSAGTTTPNPWVEL